MFVGTVGFRRLGVSFSGITLSALALSACGGSDPKPVDAKDWVSDFCDAAKDYQSSSDDLGDVTDVWAHWDAVPFLRIAEHGYDSGDTGAPAF